MVEEIGRVLDLHLPQFVQSEVMEVADIDASNLQNWVNRKFVALQNRHPGKARRRLYSASDVIKILTMVHLTNLGANVSAVGKIVERTVGVLLVQYTDSIEKGLTDGVGVDDLPLTKIDIYSRQEKEILDPQWYARTRVNGCEDVWAEGRALDFDDLPPVKIEIDFNELLDVALTGIARIVNREDFFDEEGD